MELRLRPRSALKLIDFGELWHAKDLLMMLVWRDFSVRYRQTLLGPIWFVLQPVLPTLVFMIVFGQIAGIGTEGIPSFLFYFCNQIIWGYFAANYTSTSSVLLANAHLITKVYLPKLAVPVASVATNGITMLVQLSVLIVAWCIFRFASDNGTALRLTPAIALVPLVILLAALQGLAFGFWMASITAKYRDLQQVSALVIQLWMYGSAVIFPFSEVPARYQKLVLLNPIVFTVEAFRVCVLGVGTVTWGQGIYAVISSFVILLGGLYLYNRTSRTFVDIA